MFLSVGKSRDSQLVFFIRHRNLVIGRVRALVVKVREEREAGAIHEVSLNDQ